MPEGPPDRLLAHARHGPVEVLTVAVAEIYESGTIERLGRLLRRAIESSDATIFVLDLSGVQFLTSAALGLLINLRAHLADRDYRLALAGAHGPVAQVLESTRLGQVLPVYPTLEDALRDLGC